jgi:hypothetical protein
MLEDLIIQANSVKDVLRCNVWVMMDLRSVGARDWRMRSVGSTGRRFLRRPHGIVQVEGWSAQIGRRCGEAICLEWRLKGVRSCAVPTECIINYLLLWDLSGGLDTVATLDHVCLEAYGSGPTV